MKPGDAIKILDPSTNKYKYGIVVRGSKKVLLAGEVITALVEGEVVTVLKERVEKV